ncbi:MAG: hypothetical protein JSV17_15325 [Candidatus Aminicenantes bacterium]|nr:MAG: hypothetical protein JSV17_15325 [Candidatus Aminicenantes bacterium]
MKYKDVEPNIESATLEDDLNEIRTHLQEVPIPMPSETFFEQTRSLCHARLRRSSIPKFIWAAFAVLFVLTGILMLPLAREIGLDQPLSLPVIGVLILMLQNLLMLFFTPVLIQKFRFRKNDPMNGFIDKEVCHG